MQTLSEQAILSAIANGETFEATLADESLVVRVREYVPYVCTAIHAGGKMRDELQQKCNLTQPQRFQEEDPFTDQLIESFPITLTPTHSRYEYDLNRAPHECIYDVAWDSPVWSEALEDEQRTQLLAEHARYYRILHTLVAALEQRFGGCLIVDLHSYNWQVRQYERPPVFNIGTFYIDDKRWRKPLTTMQQHLGAIELPNVDLQVEKDAVFYGKGYQARYVREHFKNTLLIPLEIKKVFMDELTGEPFPLVLEPLAKGLYLAVLETAEVFNQKLRRSKLKRRDLQTSNIEPVVLAVDKALFRLARGIDTLHYVNPVNVQQEKKRFFAHRDYNPQFRYRQLRIDPYEFREKLYKLPVSQIQDPLVRGLYRNVIDSYATKVELLTTVGTPQFRYNSLRYYGEPDEQDIKNAHFLLHAADFPDSPLSDRSIDATAAKALFEQAATRYNLGCKIIVSGRIVAKAMVDNNRRALLINRNATLSQLEVEALIHHELGVHMSTTNNALEQPLKVFRLGLPNNTYTQEGLAILSEYLSGTLDLDRLRQLSLRVLAVNLMIKGKDFSNVYRRLNGDYGMSRDDAFNLTMRVFRGGGFTKDYLYLKGFRDLVKLFKTRDITPLLVGKTDIQSLDTLDSLLERGILQPPRYVTPALSEPLYKENPVLDYLISSIR